MSWFRTPWKSPALLEAEQRLASLESQVEENRYRIQEIHTLKKTFSPMFQKMQNSYGYFLQLIQPTQKSSKPVQTHDTQGDFIQRVKQMKVVVSIIMATRESVINTPNESGPLALLGKLHGQAKDQSHEKKLALAKLRGRMEAFKTVVEQLHQFIEGTKKAHAALNEETKRVQLMGTPPTKCRSGSGIGIQSQP
jgi:hypothetical protein